MGLTGSYYHNNVSTISGFNPNSSESDIPLQPYDPERDAGSDDSMHQRWDQMGRAIGYVPDPRLHAPRPRPPSFPTPTLYASPADAAAATLSRDWEDELPDAPRPPDGAPISVRGQPNPPSGVNVPAAYAHAPSSFSPSPQSLHPGRIQSPGLSSSATASQYVTHQPESAAVSPRTDVAGTGAAQHQFYQSATGSGPLEPRPLSPPPTYP
jgi:hypothetical protein